MDLISKLQRPKYTETHVRACVYLEKEVAEVLDSLCLEKGNKSTIINEALKDCFEKLQRQNIKWRIPSR
jgi:hypothetical protein